MPIGDEGYRKAIIEGFLRFGAILWLLKMCLAAKGAYCSTMSAFRGLARLILVR